jgi:hypothetical protein
VPPAPGAHVNPCSHLSVASRRVRGSASHHGDQRPAGHWLRTGVRNKGSRGLSVVQIRKRRSVGGGERGWQQPRPRGGRLGFPVFPRGTTLRTARGRLCDKSLNCLDLEKLIEANGRNSRPMRIACSRCGWFIYLSWGGVDDTSAPSEDGRWCARDHRGSAACGQASASRCRACRSRRRSPGVVPPQIPVGSPVRSAQARQSAATGHWAQIALAAATCPTAGPDSLTGKNSSGSMPGSRHAARSVQEVLTGHPRDRTAPRARRC